MQEKHCSLLLTPSCQCDDSNSNAKYFTSPLILRVEWFRNFKKNPQTLPSFIISKHLNTSLQDMPVENFTLNLQKGIETLLSSDQNMDSLWPKSCRAIDSNCRDIAYKGPRRTADSVLIRSVIVKLSTDPYYKCRKRARYIVNYIHVVTWFFHKSKRTYTFFFNIKRSFGVTPCSDWPEQADGT